MSAYERSIEATHARRLAAEDRFLGRIERLEARAERLIGELCRDGRTVFYVNTKRGTREGQRYELTAFLIRNRYVS